MILALLEVSVSIQRLSLWSVGGSVSLEEATLYGKRIKCYVLEICVKCLVKH
jgi:hypothetical protein